MRYLRRFGWVAPLVLAACLLGAWTLPVDAQACATESFSYAPGKTPGGFEATATDGCHTVQWEGSLGQGPASGTVSFRVTNKVNPWDGDLPNRGGVDGYCEMRAAHEANGFMLHLFRVPVGTNVTVTYRCE